MARILIRPNTLKVTRAGFDPQTATERDAFLFNTDWTTDQVVAAGFVAFPGTDYVSVAIPSLHSTYKLDFFYGLSNLYAWPEGNAQELDSFLTPTVQQQITADFSGGYLHFYRRGFISLQSGGGVHYYLFSSAQP